MALSSQPQLKEKSTQCLILLLVLFFSQIKIGRDTFFIGFFMNLYIKTFFTKFSDLFFWHGEKLRNLQVAIALVKTWSNKCMLPDYSTIYTGYPKLFNQNDKEWQVGWYRTYSIKSILPGYFTIYLGFLQLNQIDLQRVASGMVQNLLH